MMQVFEKQRFLYFISILLLLPTWPAARELPDDKQLNFIVDRVMQEGTPDFVNGKTAYAVNRGVKIWYEHKRAKRLKQGTILLIMGGSASAMTWPPYLYEPLLAAGYDVIRFDHRGLGLSDWLEHWQASTAYSADDMLTDMLAILQHLDVTQVHVIGFSLGGMLGQLLAIKHSEKVLSLTSISSSAYLMEPALPALPAIPGYFDEFVKAVTHYKTDSNSVARRIKEQVGIFNVLRGSDDYHTENSWVAQMAWYEIVKRKGFNPNVDQQHTHVATNMPARYAGLKRLTIAVLIIHGINDPLISIEHAKKMASLIPHAKTLYLYGMGHDLPLIASHKITDGIVDFLYEQQYNRKRYAPNKNAAERLNDFATDI